MLKNYLKIAFRNILRNRVFSFRNIAGPAIGAGSFAPIFSYVYNEMRYDTFHKNSANLLDISDHEDYIG